MNCKKSTVLILAGILVLAFLLPANIMKAALSSGTIVSAKNMQKSKDSKAKLAYAKKMKELSRTTEEYSNWEFALIDLNKDGIPEMAITHDEGYHLTIYSYVNGKVKDVGAGFSGEQKYYPNKKLYYSVTGHSGYVYMAYYRFNGRRMVKLAYIEGDIFIGEKSYTYYIGDKKVSKTKWEKYVRKLKKGAKEEKLKYHKNTSLNREKYLQ